ncbi:MAG: hypothetical protein GF399_03915 [Candidatus Coatesbacteria bacterium]|nr:hypothetical protein [Candidatus Coatesbacteria bacterium]
MSGLRFEIEWGTRLTSVAMLVGVFIGCAVATALEWLPPDVLNWGWGALGTAVAAFVTARGLEKRSRISRVGGEQE